MWGTDFQVAALSGSIFQKIQLLCWFVRRLILASSLFPALAIGVVDTHTWTLSLSVTIFLTAFITPRSYSALDLRASLD
jgi:hypothetical protein